MAKLFADSIDEVRKSSDDEVFMIIIMAKPNESNEEYSKAGGAYVNCWVNKPTLKEAERLAIQEIESENWVPIKFDSYEILCERCYLERDNLEKEEIEENIALLQEALDNEISLLFHCWPIGEGDEEGNE